MNPPRVFILSPLCARRGRTYRFTESLLFHGAAWVSYIASSVHSRYASVRDRPRCVSEDLVLRVQAPPEIQMPLYPAAGPALIVSPPQTRPPFCGPLHAKNSTHVLRPPASSIYVLAWVAVLPAVVPYVRPEELLWKLLRSLPRDAHGAGLRPIRPAAAPAADDLSQSTSVLPPSYAQAWPAGML
ncbi:hypothetical protein C8Q78DRAFT_560667 [Trametes maxima]|nr:hypothetical protein C8Q78DRAFT_560667 [Trametes maxima]